MAEVRMKFDYDPKISLGTIVETGALLLAAGSAYVALTNADIRTDEQIKALTSDVVRIDAAQRQLQGEVRTDLKEIKASVDKLTYEVVKRK